jgi:inner membrane protein
LPSELIVTSQVDPKKLTRGLYEVVVFDSKSSITGSFDLNINPDKSGLKEIKWNDAFLTIGISDLRGIKDQIKFKWGVDILPVSSGTNASSVISTGITINLPKLTTAQKDAKIPFSFKLNLQGSKNLSYVPVGAITKVDVKSSWSSPSFDGSFLPDAREISNNGFSANWKILQLNRNFPQSWIGDEYRNNLNNYSFGVNYILGLDDYQKSMRSAKYAVMTIVLTFLIFFLVEILHKRKIHPFQYTLVGLSLSLFYVLLISISEHAHFNLAYIISAMSVIIMISLYSLSVFKSKKHSLLLVGILMSIYGFLFVILQLTDYALVMGSIGLTVILAITMYFTRNINWYNLNIDSE